MPNQEILNLRDHAVVRGMIIRTENNIVHVETSDNVNRLILDEQSNIWKGENGVSPSVLQEGDFFYARGIKQNDELLVEVVWVNIINIAGIVSEKFETSFTLNEKELVFNIDTNTEYVDGNKILDLDPKEANQPGSFVQVIGLLNKGNNQVKATRIFIFNK